MGISPDVIRDYNSLSWYKQAAVTVACFFYQFVTPDKATAFTKLVRYFKPIQASDQPAAAKADRVAEILKPDLKPLAEPVVSLRDKKCKIAGIEPPTINPNNVLMSKVESDLHILGRTLYIPLSSILVSHLTNLINDDEFSERDFKKLLQSFELRNGFLGYDVLLKLPINASQEVLRAKVKEFLDTLFSDKSLRKCETSVLDRSQLLESIKSKLPNHPEKDKVARLVMRLVRDDEFDEDPFMYLLMNLKKNKDDPSFQLLAELSEMLSDKELREQVLGFQNKEQVSDLVKSLNQNPKNDSLRYAIIRILMLDGQFVRAFEFTSPPHGKVDYLTFLEVNLSNIKNPLIIQAAIREAIEATAPHNHEVVINSISRIVTYKINNHLFYQDQALSPILELINVPKYIPKLEAIGFNRKLFEIKLKGYGRLKQDSAQLKAEYDIAQNAIFDSLIESPEAIADYIKNNLDPETANHVASELADYYTTNQKTTALQKFVNRAKEIELSTVLEENN